MCLGVCVGGEGVEVVLRCVEVIDVCVVGGGGWKCGVVFRGVWGGCVRLGYRIRLRLVTILD